MGDLGLTRDGLRVLDYGCGVGRVTSELLHRHRVTVRAIDRSPAMRRHASAALEPFLSSGAVTIGTDVELLRSAEEGAAAPAFDVVLLIEVVQHIPEPILDELLPALRRMVVPGGRFFIYGNDVLDVDRAGEIRTTPVRDVIARHLHVVREDRWPFEPAARYSMLCSADD
jgi:cyclopropane fatty-acyl-phospholipid synthase-like methyltransferase